MLTSSDVLDPAPRRILLAGVAGSGKTTLGRRIERELGIPHTEMDALFHGENWTPRPHFLADVTAMARQERWVTEWQYTSKGSDAVVAPRADTVLWLDYPYRIVRRRLLGRTLHRSLTRQELWNGNREVPIWRLHRKPAGENILAWQKATLLTWTERMPLVAERYPHLRIVRVTHPREIRGWISRAAAQQRRG